MHGCNMFIRSSKIKTENTWSLPTPCQVACKAKSLTWWSAAKLDELKQFLIEECNQGWYSPQFRQGLD